MRTIAMKTKRSVAIHTKHTETRGISLAFKPEENLGTSDALQSSALFASIASYMVKRKELYMALVATFTNSTPIGVKRLYFEASVSSRKARQYLRSMFGVVNPVIFLYVSLSLCRLVVCSIPVWVGPIMRSLRCTSLLKVFVWHKKAASYPTCSLLQKQAGSRQLGYIVAQMRAA